MAPVDRHCPRLTAGHRSVEGSNTRFRPHLSRRRPFCSRTLHSQWIVLRNPFSLSQQMAALPEAAKDASTNYQASSHEQAPLRNWVGERSKSSRDCQGT